MEITFEFVGGPHDGKVATGRLGEAGEAERHYLFTNHGMIGHRFKVASDYAVETLAREGLKNEQRHNFQRHYYEVTEHMEDDGEVYVRAEYLPQAEVERAAS